MTTRKPTTAAAIARRDFASEVSFLTRALKAPTLRGRPPAGRTGTGGVLDP